MAKKAVWNKEQATVLALQAYLLNLATLGPGHGDAIELRKKIWSPVVGDLVLELSTAGKILSGKDLRNRRGRKMSALDCIGRLVAIHDKGPRGGELRERKYEIEGLDGRTKMWIDCAFIKILEGPLSALLT